MTLKKLEARRLKPKHLWILAGSVLLFSRMCSTDEGPSQSDPSAQRDVLQGYEPAPAQARPSSSVESVRYQSAINHVGNSWGQTYQDPNPR